MVDWNKFAKKRRFYVYAPISIIFGIASLYYAFILWDCNIIASVLLGVCGALPLIKAVILVFIFKSKVDWNKLARKGRIFTPIPIIFGIALLYYAFTAWDCNSVASALLGFFGILYPLGGFLVLFTSRKVN